MPKSNKFTVLAKVLKISGVQSLEDVIANYELGLKHYKRLASVLSKLKTTKVTGITDTNGWALCEIKVEFRGVGTDLEEFMNKVYTELKELGVPTAHKSWSHGDENRIWIQLNKLPT